MIVTIYFKNTGSREGHTYHFPDSEYLQFSTDFESYLKTGMPKGGKYACYQVNDDGFPTTVEGLMLDFDSVAFVDLKVQMETLKMRRDKIEEIRQSAQH
jgi:hypothetical protein